MTTSFLSKRHWQIGHKSCQSSASEPYNMRRLEHEPTHRAGRPPKEQNNQVTCTSNKTKTHSAWLHHSGATFVTTSPTRRISVLFITHPCGSCCSWPAVTVAPHRPGAWHHSAAACSIFDLTSSAVNALVVTRPWHIDSCLREADQHT